MCAPNLKYDSAPSIQTSAARHAYCFPWSVEISRDLRRLLITLGDLELLHAARKQARGGFDKGRSLEASSKEATEAIQHAEGVSEVLIKNIVQGQQVENEKDKFSKSSTGGALKIDADNFQDCEYTSIPSEATMTQSRILWLLAEKSRLVVHETVSKLCWVPLRNTLPFKTLDR